MTITTKIKLTCPICRQPIPKGTEAITDGQSKPAHLDCYAEANEDYDSFNEEVEYEKMMDAKTFNDVADPNDAYDGVWDDYRNGLEGDR